MTRRFVALGVWLALAVAGCATAPSLETYQPKDQEETQIVSLLLRIPNGIKSRSVDLVMVPYAEDVYVGNFLKYVGVARPGDPLRISKRELRDIYAQMFREAKDVSMDVKDFRVTVRGDRAVAEARTETLFKREAGRRESREDLYRNDVIWRLRRTPVGWRIVEEIWQ